MAGSSNAQRLDALENSHRTLHAKLDQLVGAVGGTPHPAGLVDAQGRPVAAMAAPAAAPNRRSDDSTADLLAVLLPHVTAQRLAPPPPPPAADWSKVLELCLPIVLERMLDRPDPIAQMAQLKELIEPDMTEQVMGMAMPLIMAKMSGAGAAPTGGASDGGNPLAGIDPALIAQLLASQAPPHGGDGSE